MITEKWKGQIGVEHENGYYGVLYGKSSMSIFYNGKEVFHTSFRNENIKTAEDLYEQLEDMPELMKALDKHFDEIHEDDEE